MARPDSRRRHRRRRHHHRWYRPAGVAASRRPAAAYTAVPAARPSRPARTPPGRSAVPNHLSRLAGPSPHLLVLLVRRRISDPRSPAGPKSIVGAGIAGVSASVLDGWAVDVTAGVDDRLLVGAVAVSVVGRHPGGMGWTCRGASGKGRPCCAAYAWSEP